VATALPSVERPEPASPLAETAAAPATEVDGRPALQIRQAQPHDRDQAWGLQRSAFNLAEIDTPPHPGFGDQLRVVVFDQRIVSCLTLIEASLSIRGASVPMGGVRHVATHPEEQNRGYATALMRDTLAEMRRQGLVTSILFPFSFRYYRKFGYELGGNHCHVWCRPNCIPAYGERVDCRTASTADAAALARLYETHAGGSTCTMSRDAQRWARICSDPALRVMLIGEDEIAGYAITREDRDSYGGRVLQVLGLCAASRAAWRGLLGCLSQVQAESVEWFASARSLSESGLMHSPAPLREGFKPRAIVNVRPMFQFRVVDVPGALRAVRSTFPAGDYRLALKVADELLPENTEPVAIQSADGRVTIRKARPTDPSLDLDIRIFSQLYCGYMSAADAVSQGLARASGPEALAVADCLFPGGEPFISELDRF
jgi:predicted acetyltransferase